MYGSEVWDTCHTLAATAQKRGVRYYAYVRDRRCEGTQFPCFAALITERAGTVHLGASWPDMPARPVWKPVQVHYWHGSFRTRPQ